MLPLPPERNPGNVESLNCLAAVCATYIGVFILNCLGTLYGTDSAIKHKGKEK